MYEQQPTQGRPQPSQPQMEAPSRPPAPPEASPQGAAQGQDQELAQAKQIVMQAGQDLGPFMDDPRLAAQLQAALRLLTGGGPQRGGAPPQ